MAEVKRENAPVLAWMRNPTDVTSLDRCPLDELPLIDPRCGLPRRNTTSRVLPSFTGSASDGIPPLP